MTITSYYYQGKGPVLGKEYGADTGLVHFGSTSELKVTFDEEMDVLEDGDNPAGGELAVATRIKSATVNITIDDCAPENLAIAMAGTATTQVAGTVTDEVVKVYAGGMSRLAHIPAGSVVVKNQAGDVTYDLGTDYTITGAGITLPSGSSITDKSSVKVSYAYGEEANIEAMLNTGKVMTLCFDGINAARDNKSRVVDLHKVKFGPAKEVVYKDKGFARITLSGRLLRDENQTGDARSKYMRELVAK